MSVSWQLVDVVAHSASPKYKVCTVGGNTVERGCSSEVEVVAGPAGRLSDGQTDGLVSCNAAAATLQMRTDVSARSRLS